MNAEFKIADYAYAENREMTQFEVEKGIKNIGKHAFYNCRSLESLSLPCGNIEIEDGAFKNCSRLSHITLQDASKGCTSIKDILYDMNHEITVTIYYGTDDIAKLLFPHYEYEYIANEPARIFSEVGYGAGYIYRQCFFDSHLDYKRYDSLWERSCVSEDITVLARILSYRLRFSHELDTALKKLYLDYWENHLEEVLSYFIREQDFLSLRFFLALESTKNKAFSLAREVAIKEELPAVSAFLFDYQKKVSAPSSLTSKFAL